MNDRIRIFSRKGNTLVTDETTSQIIIEWLGPFNGSPSKLKRHPAGRMCEKSVLETSVRILLPMRCTLGRSFLTVRKSKREEKKTNLYSPS